MSRFVFLVAVVAGLSDVGMAQLLGDPGTRHRLGVAMASGDFDGDGYEDLAMSAEAPNFDMDNNLFSHGHVNVLYGTPVGLFPARQQLWNFFTLDVHPFERANLLGRALATGDFDNDGYDDLAIGAPVVEFTPLGFAGAAYVVYGSEEGLTNERLQIWNPLREDLNIAPTGDDNFGDAFASGDFTGDGYDDLAIGIPKFESGDFVLAGTILILRGSPDGLTSENHQFIEQPPHANMGNDHWGEEMAAGDINGDGFDDLVVGMYRSGIGETIFTGAVGVLFGTPNGITTLGYDFIRADESGVPGRAEASDWLGYSLAVADFGNDGFADLIAGIPLEDKGDSGQEIAGEINQGGFLYMFGSPVGPSRENTAEWTDAGVPLVSASNDNPADFFAWDLTTGDFNGDGNTDLAVGQPGYNPAGGVNVILSSGSSIWVVGNTFWARGQEGVPGPTSGFLDIGSVVQSGDFNGDGFDDLAAGGPADPLAEFEQSGSVTVFYGSSEGITTAGAQYFQQNLPPSPSSVIAPTDGATVLVGGPDDPIDPATPRIDYLEPSRGS